MQAVKSGRSLLMPAPGPVGRIVSGHSGPPRLAHLAVNDKRLARNNKSSDGVERPTGVPINDGRRSLSRSKAPPDEIKSRVDARENDDDYRSFIGRDYSADVQAD
jgi:hypothetical protein